MQHIQIQTELIHKFVSDRFNCSTLSHTWPSLVIISPTFVCISDNETESDSDLSDWLTSIGVDSATADKVCVALCDFVMFGAVTVTLLMRPNLCTGQALLGTKTKGSADSI